jgi:hypothetical protein
MARERFGDPIKPEEMSQLSSSTRQEGDLPANIDADARRKNIPLGSPLAVGIVKDTPFHPSPSLSEGLIDGIEGAEDFAGYLAPAKNALSHCVFRLMPGHSSGASRAGVPVHAGPPFRGMPAGVCEAG